MYKRKRAGNTITRKINSTKDTAAKADKNHYISNSYLEGFIPIDTEYFTASVILVGLILGAVFGFYAAALYVYAVIVDPIHAGALFAARCGELVVIVFPVDFQGAGSGLHGPFLGGVTEVVHVHILVRLITAV